MNKVFTTKYTKWQYIKRIIKRITIFLIVILSIIIIITKQSDTNFFMMVKNGIILSINPIIFTISYPFRKLDSAIKTISDTFHSTDKIAQLEIQLDKYRSELDKLKYIQSENIELRKNLKFIPSYALQFLTASLSFSDDGFLSHSFIIDAGKNMDIQIYQPVLANGFYIGQISSVGDDFSRVTLITDSQSKIPVMIERNHVRAFLVGNNTPYPKLVHFESKDPVIIGDRIVTSGLERKTPKGILIGTIVQDNIENDIIIQPSISKSDIEYVQVLKKFNMQRKNNGSK